MSWILGIGGYSHDASAALLHDGELVAAVQEERLTRRKHQGGIPTESIDWCMDRAGIVQSDVQSVAFYCRKSNWDRLLLSAVGRVTGNIGYTLRNPKSALYTLGYRGFNALKFRADYARFLYLSDFDRSDFEFYDHHACHAASTYFVSPFDRAVILCVDSVGDGVTTSGWLGEGNRITPLDLRISYPHSVAHVYNRITKHIGFRSTGDEYKVMGLAAYGEPSYLSELEQLIEWNRDDSYRLNSDCFVYDIGYRFSDNFVEKIGPPRRPDEPIIERHADLAASVQALFENTVVRLAKGLSKATGARSLCLAGGAALNSKCNGVLSQSGHFDAVYVPSGAGDVGTGLGAALYHWHQMLNRPRHFELRRDDWGPEYSNGDIREELERAGIVHQEVQDPAGTAARLIADGNIVAWFQGRMEFGPRALGNRSILADPRGHGVKDRINKNIKFREEFRPFAPSILRSRISEYFGLDIDCPFMTHVLEIVPEKTDEIPAVVHEDGTGRLQTVDIVDQPLYASLIEEFEELTGVPVVLNTSFNLAGEPIVCSPFDALRCFYTSGIDALVMGNYVVTKSPSPTDVREELSRSTTLRS